MRPDGGEASAAPHWMPAAVFSSTSERTRRPARAAASRRATRSDCSGGSEGAWEDEAARGAQRGWHTHLREVARDGDDGVPHAHVAKRLSELLRVLEQHRRGFFGRVVHRRLVTDGWHDKTQACALVCNDARGNV